MISAYHMYTYIMCVVFFACICIRLPTQIKTGQSFVQDSGTKQRELNKVEHFFNVS